MNPRTFSIFSKNQEVWASPRGMNKELSFPIEAGLGVLKPTGGNKNIKLCQIPN